ncbi:hypothetical protein EON83_03015 [bacterium]|nr:MAG: hypothetical protein EON83_03015 [bacterium]
MQQSLKGWQIALAGVLVAILLGFGIWRVLQPENYASSAEMTPMAPGPMKDHVAPDSQELKDFAAKMKKDVDEGKVDPSLKR